MMTPAKAAVKESEKNESKASEKVSVKETGKVKDLGKMYRIKFRPSRQIRSATSKIKNLKQDELVMVQTDHGLEPANIAWTGVELHGEETPKKTGSYNLVRRATRDEKGKYDNLLQREEAAFTFCTKRIATLGLVMSLISVERFFNGSKIIFYFTAENRVDFRGLVKELVQEFRTRVEMRQIGVRHETQMIGGLGCCGRELCCASFMKKFVPVSIKMAKEQDLPLNPSKISGACNRLLCCLTHEYDTYKALKKGMPKPGKYVKFDEKLYKVIGKNTLKGEITIMNPESRDDTHVLTREQWTGMKSQTPPKVQVAARANPDAADKKSKDNAAKSKPKPRKHKGPRRGKKK